MILGISMFWFGVLVFALFLGLWAAICLWLYDPTEHHDEAVRMRRSGRRESTPPEWADPEKWWESEGWK